MVNRIFFPYDHHLGIQLLFPRATTSLTARLTQARKANLQACRLIIAEIQIGRQTQAEKEVTLTTITHRRVITFLIMAGVHNNAPNATSSHQMTTRH